MNLCTLHIHRVGNPAAMVDHSLSAKKKLTATRASHLAHEHILNWLREKSSVYLILASAGSSGPSHALRSFWLTMPPRCFLYAPKRLHSRRNDERDGALLGIEARASTYEGYQSPGFC